MEACVRSHGAECSDIFDVEQSIGQRFVIAPPLFNTFAALRGVSEKRVVADAATMLSMVRIQRRNKKEENGTPRAGRVDGRGEKREKGGARIVGYAVR